VRRFRIRAPFPAVRDASPRAGVVYDTIVKLKLCRPKLDPRRDFCNTLRDESESGPRSSPHKIRTSEKLCFPKPYRKHGHRFTKTLTPGTRCFPSQTLEVLDTFSARTLLVHQGDTKLTDLKYNANPEKARLSGAFLYLSRIRMMLCLPGVSSMGVNNDSVAK
jgi:hypothetical protein